MSKPKDKDLARELEKWAATEEGSQTINSVMEKALQAMLNKWADTGKLTSVKKAKKKYTHESRRSMGK